MKKFLIKLGIFLIPVIIFIAWWEYGLSKMENSYMLKRSQMDIQAPKIEVLVLGGSFTLRGIDPEYFSMRGYNAANIQQSIFYDTRIALKYIDEMTSLKVVLISVSYNSLWWQTPEFRDYFYADYWGIRYPTIKWYDMGIYSRILQYGNNQAWKFALQGFNANLTIGYHENGFSVKPGDNMLINDSIGKHMITHNEKVAKKEELYSNISDIKALLEELARRKIHAVILVPPEPTVLSKYMKPNKLHTMDSVMTLLCNAYNNCKVFNYQDDTRFNIGDFKNASHLNKTGAIKFSQIINQEVLKKYIVPN